DRQSAEADPAKRRKLVWEVERKLAEDASRPVLLYSRFATCHAPAVKAAVGHRRQPLELRLHATCVDSSWIDMLAGLAKPGICIVPPVFGAEAGAAATMPASEPTAVNARRSLCIASLL